MAPYQARVVVVFDRAAVVARQYEAEATRIRHETIDAIKAGSVANAAEVTGSLKTGHYVTDDRGSGYAEAVSAAQAVNADVEILPEVPQEPGVSILSNCVAHAEANEFYTGDVNPGAHPFMTPAAEAQRPNFERKIRALGGSIR